MQPGSKRRKAKEGLRIRPAAPRRSWGPRNRLRTKTPEREVPFVRQVSDHLRVPAGGHPQRTKPPPREVCRERELQRSSDRRHKPRRPPQFSSADPRLASRRSEELQRGFRPRHRLRTKTPEREVLYVRQVPDHLRVPGGGHPQKRLRTKTPPREVLWERGVQRSGDRQHKPRRSSRNDADARLAKSSQECKRRGRPPKKEASNNRKRCEQSAGSEDLDIWSPTLCQEDMTSKKSWRGMVSRFRSPEPEEPEAAEDGECAREPGTESFAGLIPPKSEVVDVDTGSEEELHKDVVAAVRPKRAAPQARDETEVTIQMIKKILDFRGHRAPAGQRCYARRAVFELLEELFLQAQKLVGDKIWRGQVLHYISDLVTELETSSKSCLYQNASFWKGALLLLLKHLGAPKEEVQQLRQKYYLTAGRIKQTTVRRPDFKDLSQYYAECKPFDSVDFDVDPAAPCLLRPDRPRMKVTRAKAETEDGDAPPKSLRSWMRYYVVREDNSAHLFRTAKYATVRHCLLEACKDTGFEPESFLCLCENEAVSLDAEIGSLPWPTHSQSPRLLYVYLRNTAKPTAARCCEAAVQSTGPDRPALAK
ncbi:unnamed protein product [Symbiodinium sp. CCMP2592]|nr:unnamed protein product [Symbiodinium sp. CCMP2592]